MQALFAHPGVGIAQCGGDGRGGQFVQPTQCPEGARPRFGARGLGGDFFEEGNRRAIGAFDEAPLGVGAPPFVGRLQGRDGFVEVVGSDRRSGGGGARNGRIAEDAVNAAAVLAAFEVEEAARFLRHVARVVDLAAIHVGDVERAIGAFPEKDGPEPNVRGGEKLLAAGGRIGAERGAVGAEHLALHEILRGLADEDVARVLGPQARAAEHEHAARRGERAGMGRGHQ